MRLLADIHISPFTVAFLRTLGHDVVRADAMLPNTATDEEIVTAARWGEGPR
jgi:predicted nuclease of predicted toxin-antitoxin system